LCRTGAFAAAVGEAHALDLEAVPQRHGEGGRARPLRVARQGEELAHITDVRGTCAQVAEGVGEGEGGGLHLGDGAEERREAADGQPVVHQGQRQDEHGGCGRTVFQSRRPQGAGGGGPALPGRFGAQSAPEVAPAPPEGGSEAERADLLLLAPAGA